MQVKRTSKIPSNRTDPMLNELYLTEEYLEKILFYDFDTCLELLKAVSNMLVFHNHHYYCHHAQPVETQNINSTKKNKCMRHASITSLNGSTIYQKKSNYTHLIFIMLNDDNLYVLDKTNKKQLDQSHTHFVINFYSEHDGNVKYPCCEQQQLKYKFSPEEEAIIKQNLLEFQGTHKIQDLLESIEHRKVIKCTLQQLRRHAAILAKILLPDHIMISKHVEEFNLKYEIVINEKTQELTSFGVVNPKYVKLFEKDGASVVFNDFTHIRLQNQNMMVLLCCSQTIGSKFTYILGAYLFRNKDNQNFCGETDIMVETAYSFFKKHISFKTVRLSLTDAGPSIMKVNQQMTQHAVGALCSWHWYQNFKQCYGDQSNNVRYLFFSLMKASTQADLMYRENKLKTKLQSINQFNREKWNHLLNNYDKLILFYRSSSINSQSVEITTSAAESVNYAKIKRHISRISFVFMYYLIFLFFLASFYHYVSNYLMWLDSLILLIWSGLIKLLSVNIYKYFNSRIFYCLIFNNIRKLIYLQHNYSIKQLQNIYYQLHIKIQYQQLFLYLTAITKKYQKLQLIFNLYGSNDLFSYCCQTKYYQYLIQLIIVLSFSIAIFVNQLVHIKQNSERPTQQMIGLLIKRQIVIIRICIIWSITKSQMISTSLSQLDFSRK
ncbi:Conserved_hypothetical protein [Hexamita inflata]|uniref:Uncharacterized protein n=1 Tax=Hexamita inflata TaxID=28002 RepID=A0AA86UU50_9EUKA|nr:Conserved hypothetical protein [Hexamita inflata]